MAAMSLTRRAMERTLLVTVAAEAVIGRVIVRGLERKPRMIDGVPERVVPPAWYVALDYLALFLLYFATVVAVLTLVVGRIEARERWSSSTRGEQVGLAMSGVFTLLLAAAVAGGATNHGGPPWLVLTGLTGVAAYAAIVTWVRRPGIALAAGVTTIAVPLILYGVAAMLTTRLWSEAEIFDGVARVRFGNATRLAIIGAALASPYLLAPRPFAHSALRVPSLAAALIVASAGAVCLRLDYLGTIAALNRTLGLDLEPRQAGQFVAFYLLAFATIAWTITACLIAPSPARRRLGVGLALVVAAGVGFAWPMNFAAVAVGIMAMADAAPAIAAEERATWSPATPTVDDDTWHGYVGQVVTRLRVDGDDASAVSVRGDHGQVATVILTRRRAVPVRLCINRVHGSVVSLDVVCGREASGGPAWSVAARAAGGLAEPPGTTPSFVLGDQGVDAVVRCRGDRAALEAALDADARAVLRDGFEGWMAAWPGIGVRHRVYPGHGAAVDGILPLGDLAARRVVPGAAVAPLLARVDWCAAIAARAGVVDEEAE